MAINLTDPVFTDENKAREHLEAIRWPAGPTCPHCGSVDKVYRLNGKSHRPGLIHCNDCDGSFTVTTGSVMESSHVPLHKWVLAYRLMAGSKKGISAHQLHRTIGVTYKTAWFMAHRIRESMKPVDETPMGGRGMVVEADETYFGPVSDANRRTTPTRGGKFTKGGRTGPSNKRAIVSLVERGGEVRSFHVENADQATVQAIIAKNLSNRTRLHTDESRLYTGSMRHVSGHETVKHTAGEYVRGDVTTNSVEGFFSVFKRGMRGTYQHCGEQHLHRYLTEFDFRFSNRSALGVNDTERATRAIKGAEGKRLTYQGTCSAK